MKELKPKIQFSYDEYVISWSDLLKGIYFKIISMMDFQTDKTQNFDLKLFCLLPVTAKLMLTNESKVGKKICDSLEKDIVDYMVGDIFEEPHIRSEWIEFYNKFSPIMYGVLIESGKTVNGEQQLIGISGILLDKIPMDNQNRAKQVQELSIMLSEAMNAIILKLAKNTGLSPKLMGKPNFMVLKD